jgi:hypothetical protein
MADILTHLRELSVAHFLVYQRPVILSPAKFLAECKAKIIGAEKLKLSQIVSGGQTFNPKEMKTISNGIRLGCRLLREFRHLRGQVPKWVGPIQGDHHPSDLIVGDEYISLKESSFILKNMGLYYMLNSLLGEQKYSRGLHVFEKFALKELVAWFNYTRQTLKKLGSSSFTTKGKTYKIRFSKNDMEGTISGKPFRFENFIKCSYENFQANRSTSGKKAFCKWINHSLGSDGHYLKMKKKVCDQAGRNIKALLLPQIGQSPATLHNFFSIVNTPYILAKVTDSSIEIFKVPSIENSCKNMKIKNIEVSVPSSQLNIFTTLESKLTQETVIFRNEIRYSHGQLVGTPEAKLYIKEGKLTTMYEAVVQEFTD